LILLLSTARHGSNLCCNIIQYRDDNTDHSPYFSLFTEAISAQRELQEALLLSEKENTKLLEKVNALEKDLGDKESIHSLQLKERGVLIRELSNVVTTLRRQVKSEEFYASDKGDNLAGKRKTSPSRLEFPIFNLNLNDDVNDVRLLKWFPDTTRVVYVDGPEALAHTTGSLPSLCAATSPIQAASQRHLFTSPSTLVRGEPLSAKISRGEVGRSKTSIATTSMSHNNNQNNNGVLSRPYSEPIRSASQNDALSSFNHSGKKESSVGGVGKRLDDIRSSVHNRIALNAPVEEKDMSQYSSLLDKDGKKEILALRRQVVSAVADRELKQAELKRPKQARSWAPEKVFK